MKFKYIPTISQGTLLFFVLLLLLINNLQSEKLLTIISLIFIFYAVLISFFKNDYLLIRIVKKIKINSLFNLFFLLFIFLYLIIFQNYFLNYETITWDVSSYLVASQELEQGNLPFSTQWESKGPLNNLLFYLLSSFVGKNYVLFKLLNDLLIFFIILNLYYYLQKKNKNNSLNYVSLVFFTVLFSTQWYVSEYTEFYCLILLSYVHYFYLKKSNSKSKFLFIGILFSFSALINQGSLIIILGYLYYFFINYEKSRLKNIYLYLGTGFILPFLFIIFIYARSNLFEVLLANYFYIPFGYTGSSASSLYEIRVFLREIFNYNMYLYFSLVSIPILLTKDFISNKTKFYSFFKDLDYILFIFGIAYYFVAGHNYYHHFIYALYFLCIILTKVSLIQNKQFISILIFASFIFANLNYTDRSIKNLSDIENVYLNYPLKNLALEIDSHFESKTYTVFALDYVLVLYYLDKPNYSYIVHPTNHYQGYITDPLIDAGLLVEDEVEKLFNSKPDVLICNTKAIDNGGQVINFDPIFFGKLIEENQSNSCSLEYLEDDYFLIDSKKYRDSANLNFYKDPYKDMNVFILKIHGTNDFDQ